MTGQAACTMIRSLHRQMEYIRNKRRNSWQNTWPNTWQTAWLTTPNSLHDLDHVALLMDTHRSTRHYAYTCEYICIYIYTWKAAIGLSHKWEYASPADLATLPTYQLSPSCWPNWQPCRPATSMCMRMYICIWINICICKYISVYIVPICTSTCASQAQGPPKPTVTLDVRIHFYETYIYNIWTSMYKFNVHRFRFR